MKNGLDACGLAEARVLVALSGGADSVALLRGLLHWATERSLTPVAAHLDHQLRGGQSQADAAWAADMCRRCNVPVVAGSEPVARRAAELGLGLEETSRKLRYEFLIRTAREQNCEYVAAAHTADDQAETILHHILRGTGLDGLRGMPRVRTLEPGLLLVRPLLEIARGDVEAYLSEIGQDWRSDPTNLDETFTRNRIRHRLLPALEDEYNPQVRDALRRLGRQAADATDAIEQLAGRLLEQALVETSGRTCRLNCEVLADQPRHLLRAAFALLWRQLDWPRQRMGFSEWNRLVNLVQQGGAATLPANVDVRKTGHELQLERRDA